MEDGFDEELGFGAGDEGVAGDAEVEAVELLVAGEVLDGLFGGAAGDEGAVGLEERGGELGFGVGEEPGAVAEEEMGEEGLGLAAVDGGGGFGEGVAEGHRCALRLRIDGLRSCADGEGRSGWGREVESVCAGGVS